MLEQGPALKPAKAVVASSLSILILITTKDDKDRRVSRKQKSLNACFKVDILRRIVKCGLEDMALGQRR